jgi:hypothetical protein
MFDPKRMGLFIPSLDQKEGILYSLLTKSERILYSLLPPKRRLSIPSLDPKWFLNFPQTPPLSPDKHYERSRHHVYDSPVHSPLLISIFAFIQLPSFQPLSTMPT